MSDHALISCIVPVFNGERFIAAALDSIFAQTYATIEVIVVDDGSTDDTAEVAAGFGARVNYLHQENAGQIAAQNRGVAAARGAFIAFLDADDLWHEEKLARQMALFEARPKLDICNAHMKDFWEEEVAQEAESLPHLAAPRVGVVQSYLVRRSLFDRVGMIDETMEHRGWTDWCVRAVDSGAVSETMSDILVYRRIHGDNMSRHRSGADNEEFLRMVKATLDRRRKENTPGGI